MRLLHYTDKPDPILLFSVKQDHGFNNFALGKPTGLWVSVDDDWKRWCEGEKFRLDRLAYAHEVKLNPDAEILRIRTVQQLDRFTARYALESDEPGFNIRMDWPRLEGDGWQGIIIAPYQWSRRLGCDCAWYYCWDCASGCVWDAEAVESIQLVSKVPA